MTNVLIEQTSIENIANAIRSKNGSSEKYKPAEMADAIIAISGEGGITPTGTKNILISQNGVHTENVTTYEFAKITTNVPNSYGVSDEGKVVDNGSLVSQTSKSINANGTYDTTSNNEVVVNVPSGSTPTGTKNISITQNGTTTEDVTNYASAQIAVNVPNPSTGTLSIKKDGTYNVTNYASVEVKTAMEKVNVTGTTVTQELAPNKFYVFGEVTSLTITLGTGDSDLANDYHFRFTSGTTATVLSLPQTVNMPTGFAVEASKVYEISIVDNYGTVTSW